MYVMVSNRPDISHVVGVVSRYMENPGKEHWEAVKWLFRYLRGKRSYSITYDGSRAIHILQVTWKKGDPL